MALRFTILGDGTTDASLKPIFTWMLQQIPQAAQHGFTVEFTTGRGGHPPAVGLAARIERSLREFPCDLLFVHRDAEKQDPSIRFKEIADAASLASNPLHVPAVPVRMTEAWLLIDEHAIRKAADNPNGNKKLDMPSIKKVEQLADPKQICDQLLILASEKTGRRLEKFNRKSELAWRRMRLANLIDDFSPLLDVPAFKRLFDDASKIVETL